MTDLVTGEDNADVRQQQLSLHPQAFRPNFLWTAQLPTSWAFLDTHPASWQRQAERIIDQFYSGQRLKSEQRKAIYARLEEAVKAAQDNKVLLSFVLPGTLDDGEMSACTLLVRWQSFSPQSASMTIVDTAFSGREGFEHRTTDNDAAYALFGGRSQIGPLTDRRTIWNYQAALPVPSTSWVAMVSGVAPEEGLAPTIRDMVIRLTNSINTFPELTGRVLDPELALEPEQLGDLRAADDDIVLTVAAE